MLNSSRGYADCSNTSTGLLEICRRTLLTFTTCCLVVKTSTNGTSADGNVTHVGEGGVCGGVVLQKHRPGRPDVHPFLHGARARHSTHGRLRRQKVLKMFRLPLVFPDARSLECERSAPLTKRNPIGYRPKETPHKRSSSDVTPSPPPLSTFPQSEGCT